MYRFIDCRPSLTYVLIRIRPGENPGRAEDAPKPGWYLSRGSVPDYGPYATRCAAEHDAEARDLRGDDL